MFDDLLTRGDSMRKFGQRLTSLGANVIAGITLGKTFHTREEDNSHPSPSLYQYDGQDEEDDDYDYDD